MSGVRFAPSPTGRFHLGNLRTAWVSWKLARAHQLPWIVRFEDIDLPRVLPGAQEQQLADMRELGLVPDEIIVQSTRRERHWELFQKAVASGQIYPCVCSRKDIQSAMETLASAPHLALGSLPPVYSGKCRNVTEATLAKAKATPQILLGWRFKSDEPGGAHDPIIARTSAQVDASSFVPSYHWACAIDDLDGRYDLLVRAADLSSATEIQRKIQAWICKVEGLEPRLPAVFHTSLIVQNDGHRLEKRTAGVTLHELNACGWTIEAILKTFEESFDFGLFQRDFEPFDILSEEAASRSLQEISFDL
ncbi:MAG: glutamate--tRNA ligase family protein [Bdellovibrionia bacterium]